MKNNTSRRLFIRNVSLASVGAMCLSSANNLAALNLSEDRFPGYNPYAAFRTDLRTSNLFGKHITVNGKIYCKDTLSAIGDAKLEVWHLSPNSTKFRHHAKLTTNSNGEFSFKTDFPGRENGKSARIYFKTSTKYSSYTTQLLISQNDAYITGEHWEENQSLGDLLFPVKKQSNIQFNISI